MTVDRTKFNEIQEIPKGGLLNIQRANGGVLAFDNVEYIPSGGGALFLTAKVHLTTAQILALASVPVEIVPSPGPNKLIVLILAIYRLRFGTRPFSGDIDTRIGAIGATFNPGQGTLSFTSDWVTTVLGDWNDALADIADAPLTLAANNGGRTDGGAITTAILNAGGAGYAPGDTGTISAGNSAATYVVDTVDGNGAVLTFSITAGGAGYLTATGVATSVSTGNGDFNFTVDVTGTTHGDGSLDATVIYTIQDVT